MHNEDNTKLDEWEEKLEVKLAELKVCQNTKQYDTCTKCSLFFDCDVRRSYIKAVYESMSKGSTGGFEF
mgnify:CR=1 FL=1